MDSHPLSPDAKREHFIICGEEKIQLTQYLKEPTVKTESQVVA